MRVSELELELEFEFNATAELELELVNSSVALHAEKDGHFIETVNYFYFPLHLLRSGRLPELPSSGAHVLLVRTVRC